MMLCHWDYDGIFDMSEANDLMDRLLDAVFALPEKPIRIRVPLATLDCLRRIAIQKQLSFLNLKRPDLSLFIAKIPVVLNQKMVEEFKCVY